MSRDSFYKPRKIRPPLVEDVEPLVRDYEAMADTDEPVLSPRRLARRAEHRASPNETSIAEELLSATAAPPEALEFAEDYPILAGPAGPLLTARYNPAALSGGFTDAFTLGNAAELAALASDEDYDTALAEAEARNAREYARNPGSAAVGAVGGLANQAALLPALRLAPVAGAGRVANIARAVAPTAALGTAVGAVGGALAAPEGERLEAAARGGARGLAAGTVAGGLGAVGEAIRGAAPANLLLRAARLPAAGAASGAEFGILGTPGTHPNATPGDFARGAGHGAAFGAVAEPVLTGAGGIFRALGRRMPAREPLPPVSLEDIDEVAMLTGEAPVRPGEAQADSPVLMPEEIVRNVRASENRSALGDALRAPFEAPPEYDRLSSLSALGPGARAAARQGSAAFGSVRGHVDELQRMGLASEGTTYSREAEHARALAALDEIGASLGRTHARVAAHGGTRSAEDTIARLNASADELLARAPEDQATQAAAARLRAFARDLYEEGPGGTESSVLEDVTSELPALGDDPVIAQVESLGIPKTLDYPGVRSRMARAGEDITLARRARQSGIETPQARVAPLIYRALAPEREALAREAIGEEYGAHAAQQRGFQALNAIQPVDMRLDINAAANPADLRGALARMGAMSSSASQGGGVADQAVSGFAAQLRERLLANYMHSVRASFNERGLPALSRMGERLSLAPDTAQRIDSALSGGAGLATGGILGAADATRAAIASPETSVAPEAARAAQDEAVRRYTEDRNAALLQRMSGTAAEADPNVDQGYVQERNDRLRERMLRGRTTP